MIRDRAKPWAVAAALIFPSACLAHGEGEPGPNGGEIRMPGAFHVEVRQQDDALMVYLLNMQFEDPRVADSSVKAVLEQNGEAVELPCRVANGPQAFRCPLPDGATLTRGTLAIDASRAGRPADPAHYELPLAWSGAAGR
ncbi:MAG: hypothetical protein WEC99_03555 [Halofilum sp. (in: g-proteobacteria)]